MSVIKIKDDAGNWVPISTQIKPAIVPTIVNTATYTVPASGGDYWIDAVAAGTNINITLPLNPVDNTTVSFQLIDNSTRDLFVKASVGNFIAFQAAGATAKYAGTTRNLIEVFRFYNSRWFQAYSRFIYV